MIASSSRRLLLQQQARLQGRAIATHDSSSSVAAVTSRWQHDSFGSSSPVGLSLSPRSALEFQPTTTNINNVNNARAPNMMHSWSRHFATDANPSKKEEEKSEETAAADVDATAEAKEEKESSSSSGESLRETVNRMKQEKDGKTSDDKEVSKGNDTRDLLHKAADAWDAFAAEVGLAWQDLIKAGESKDINKKLKRPEATTEGDAEYTGPVSIMVIDESEHLTAWERMQRRLTDAPIIQDILTKSEVMYEKTGAKQAKEKIDHLREDATEAWETSQNPWVYRASSVYDTLTAETPESIAVKELRVLDPEFTLDDWRRDVVGHSLPQIMEWFLQGKTNQLKPWLAEGVFKRIASEIAARNQEGVQIDTHVLGIMNSEILAVEVSLLLLLLLQYFCFHVA